MKIFIIVIIFGFPVALIFSWAFEITPEGIKLESEIEPTKSIARRTGRKIVAITIALAVVAAGLFVYQLVRPVGTSLRDVPKIEVGRLGEPSLPQKSIAVLPFDNLSRYPDNAYFCEGVQDEILTRLAKVADLKVISRTSTQHLKGRFFWNKRTGVDLRKAIDYFNQAVAKDLNYALAYVGLSDSYLLLPNYGSTSSQEALPPARTAAKKALALDDSLAEAHASLGLLATIELDLERALSELERAVQLKPNYATAHHWLALADMTLARFDPAIREGKRAIELDPLSVIITAIVSWLYLCARRYDEGEAQARKTLEIDPHFFLAHYYLGIALHLKGRLSEAIPEFQKSFDLNGDPYSLGILGQAYARNGQNEEARKILARLNERRNAQRVAPYALALVYLGLGDKEHAIDELDRGYRDGETNYLFVIKVDPLLDDLRGNPRFDALVQKVVGPK